MSRRRKLRPQRISLCAELDEDDGIDPRRFFAEGQTHDDRKTRQLCKQVLRTLSFVLAGECRDEVVSELVVHSVVPAPDSSRLLVTLEPAPHAPPVASDEILARLQRAYPFLRQEVAAAVSRRKVPELTFEVVPREESPA